MSSRSQNFKVANAILPLVKEEIATILAAYPRYPYQQAFEEENRQLKLLAYVLNRVPGLYVVVETEEELNCYPVASQRVLDIEIAIHQGIQNLVPAVEIKQSSLRERYERQQFIKVI
ncbi:MAG: late competence development ComFB family protein [Cyanophyceae cyanobacterium]